MKILIILLTASMISSCKMIDNVKQVFGKKGTTSISGSNISGYTGGISTGSQATRWLNDNTSPPDMSCSSVMLDANEIEIAAGHNGPWKKEWTDGLIEDLDNHPYNQILEDGVFSDSYLEKTGCGGYSRMSNKQRKAYVIHQLSEVCRPESGFAPKTRYSECGGSSCWTNIGLCQMIKKTVNLPVYGCNLSSSEDLADPRKHLRCAILVLNQNMRKRCNGSLPCSKTYWGPMRPGKKAPQMIAGMRAHMSRLHPYCKKSNWNGLDRDSYSMHGNINDNLNGQCQKVADTDRAYELERVNPRTIRTLKGTNSVMEQ